MAPASPEPLMHHKCSPLAACMICSSNEFVFGSAVGLPCVLIGCLHGGNVSSVHGEFIMVQGLLLSQYT